ncbi:MAG: YgjP-like metallopeptidase domain-containing protein, partial [Bradymonadaceae bacterium]
MNPKLTVDDLEFELRRSGSRKTLEITIDRGGALLLSAPPGVETSVLEDFVREKRFWIYTKLAEKDALSHPVVSKEFVTGEGFMYLGRNYRLLLVDEQDRALKLEAGRFKLRRNQVGLARIH